MVSKVLHKFTRCASALLACAVGLMTGGCDGGRGPLDEPDGTEGELRMEFRVKLSENYGASRAVSRAETVETEPSTGFEDYLAFERGDMAFLLFDGEGRYVENLLVLNKVKLSGTGDSAEYMVLCALSAKPGEKFRVMALANWGIGNYPMASDMEKGVTTVADVCAGLHCIGGAKFAYNPLPDKPFTPSESTPIPMYGIKTCTGISPSEADNTYYAGTIDLLRAMAKIEVEVAKDARPYVSLQSVTLQGFNSKGFAAPDGMDGNTGYAAQPHIPDDAVADTVTPLQFTVLPDGTKGVIYVPEYRNIADAVKPCFLTVTLVDKSAAATAGTYRIDFCKYASGRPTGERLDIVRNSCYHFTVNKDDEFSVDVLPYRSQKLEPVFGI